LCGGVNFACSHRHYEIGQGGLPRNEYHKRHQQLPPTFSSTSNTTQFTMPPAISPPEKYFIKRSTPHVPNSPLPVLIYRSALPLHPTPVSTCEAIEPNNWLKGGVFKHYGAHHFHSVTHECYAVFKGSSRLLLGRGPLDPVDEHDLIVDLKPGDAIVLPAGVAHCSLSSSEDYEYVGLYPKVCLVARCQFVAEDSADDWIM
jgi:uncharacterized protein YjlB